MWFHCYLLFTVSNTVQIKALNKYSFDVFDIQAITVHYITIVYFDNFDMK